MKKYMKKSCIVLLIIAGIVLLSAFTIKSRDKVTVNNEHIDHMATVSPDSVHIIDDDTATFESN